MITIHTLSLWLLGIAMVCCALSVNYNWRTTEEFSDVAWPAFFFVLWAFIFAFLQGWIIV